MTKKNLAALAVLVAGGYFRKALAPSYPTGRLMFSTHLFNAAGERIPGHGLASLESIQKWGCLSHDISCVGTVERWAFQLPTDPDQAVRLDRILETL
jgi:hypothetical protein